MCASMSRPNRSRIGREIEVFFVFLSSLGLWGSGELFRFEGDFAAAAAGELLRRGKRGWSGPRPRRAAYICGPVWDRPLRKERTAINRPKAFTLGGRCRANARRMRGQVATHFVGADPCGRPWRSLHPVGRGLLDAPLLDVAKKVVGAAHRAARFSSNRWETQGPPLTKSGRVF